MWPYFPHPLLIWMYNNIRFSPSPMPSLTTSIVNSLTVFSEISTCHVSNHSGMEPPGVSPPAGHEALSIFLIWEANPTWRLRRRHSASRKGEGRGRGMRRIGTERNRGSWISSSSRPPCGRGEDNEIEGVGSSGTEDCTRRCSLAMIVSTWRRR